MNKTLKNILIILAVVLVIFGVVVNAWNFSLEAKDEKREVFHTYIVGDQERLGDVNGDGVVDKDEVVEERPFLTVEYEKDTYFSVTFNYFMDESRTGYYSQTLEYSVDKGHSLDDLVYRYAFRLDETMDYDYLYNEVVFGGWAYGLPYWITNHYWNGFVYGRPNAEAGIRVLSGSEFIAEDSSSTFGENSLLRVQIGDDIYAMGFAGRGLGYKYSTGLEPTLYKEDIGHHCNYVNTYYSVDPYFIAQTLYNSVKGKEESVVIRDVREYGDLFTYRKYNASTGKYDLSVSGEELALVRSHVFSYLGVEFRINQSSVTEAI